MIMYNVNFISVSEMKKIRLLTTFFVSFLLISISAVAQQLSGEVYYPTSRLKADISSALSPAKPFSGVISGSSLNIPVGFPFVIDDVSFQYLWQMPEVAIQDETNINISVKSAQILFVVPHLSIDTTIVKYIDGAVINIKVKSECSNIKMVATSNQVNLKLSRVQTTGSLFDLALEAQQLQYDKPNLEIASFECSNIQGLEDVIKENIFENFNQLDLYNNVFLQKLNIVVQDKIHEVLSTIDQSVQESFNKFKLNLNQKIRVKSIASDKVIIQFAFNKELNKDAVVDEIPSQINSGTYGVMFNVKKDDLVTFIKQLLKSKLESVQISSKQIKAFDKLTKSRVQQFFVWPALMKRKKGQELVLRPTVENLNLAVQSNTFSKVLQTQINTGLWAIDENKPMVYFKSNFVSNITFLNGSETSFPITGLKTKAQWDADYLKEKRCSKRIATSIIDTIGQAVFNQNWAKQNLNAIILGQTQQYRFKDVFNLQNKTLFIRLESLK